MILPENRDFPWHRVFHPLCGADPLTLARLVARRGPPSRQRWPAFAIACAMSLTRLPFTLAERLADLMPGQPPPPPVFVVGHPRSGTTHLHNVLAASGAFGVVPPVIAALPWERRTVAPFMRPFIDARLPRTRLIDGVEMRGDDPTEDEVALANAGDLSYFHALYFPARFQADYRDGLLHRGSRAAQRRRERTVRWYVAGMSRGERRPLLLKNPAYTARVDLLPQLFPGARIVHIHRDPAEVFASTRRSLRLVLAEMALQDWRHVDVERAILDTYPEVMASLRRARTRLAGGTFAEVAFADLVADPAATIDRLWEALELPGGDAARACAHAYAARMRAFRPSTRPLPDGDLARLRHLWPDEFAAYASAAGS